MQMYLPQAIIVSVRRQNSATHTHTRHKNRREMKTTPRIYNYRMKQNERTRFEILLMTNIQSDFRYG